MDSSAQITIQVSEEYEKQRLDVFITRICDFIPSRSFAAKIISNHKITVNDKISLAISDLKSAHEKFLPEFMS